MNSPMNFIDKVGPPVSADWLNRVDRMLLGSSTNVMAVLAALEARVRALEVQFGQTQTQMANADPGGGDVLAGRGTPSPPDQP